MRRSRAVFSIGVLLAVCAASLQANQDMTSGSEVSVLTEVDGSFVLMRNGEAYPVKGAGFSNGDLGLLAAFGGNSIRTWGIDQLEQLVDGKPLLDRAHELGLSVTAGFWVKHARHGFDYTDAASIEAQRKSLREAVLKYRDHPALLAWGLGNEMEEWLPESLDAEVVWRELNHLAGIIKELDPNHPVMTVIAGASSEKISAIRQHYPNLDILGVNAYSSAPRVGRRLVDFGWDGPYMLGEFGVTGTWETATTSWNAPIEADPSTKAGETYAAYTIDRDQNAGRSLGSYVFLWGNKQEATATWFGMFLPSGEKLPRVDAMAYAWSGRWPVNRAPKLRSLESPVAFNRVKPGTLSHAVVDCIDREGDALSYRWDIRAESSDRRVGGDAEAVPPSFPDAIEEGQGSARIEFRTPSQPGAYRVFVTAYDGKGGAAVHNLPFFVED